MSFTEIRDVCLWPKHIHGNSSLKQRLLGLDEGELVKLSIDGFVGVWEKMKDGADGRRTDGLKPIGPAKQHWHSLYKSKRGDIVPIGGDR